MSNEITLHAIERGRQAWKRIRSDSTYGDWMQVGEALDIGRTECMRSAHTNEPRGRRYNEAFSAWLTENGFADIDKGTRSRLEECMKNRARIEAWRSRLSLTERLRLNHPNGVIRKWRAEETVPEKSAAKSRGANALKLENVRLQDELHRIKQNAGDVFSAKDSARDIAKVLFDMLSESKFEQVLKIGNELRQQHAAAMREGIAEVKIDAKAKVLRGEP
jgi:hypothetical protein